MTPDEDLDPNYEWVEVAAFGEAPRYMKGPCLHLTCVPVTSLVDSDQLALLCTNCDAAWDMEGEPL